MEKIKILVLRGFVDVSYEVEKCLENFQELFFLEYFNYLEKVECFTRNRHLDIHSPTSKVIGAIIRDCPRVIAADVVKYHSEIILFGPCLTEKCELFDRATFYAKIIEEVVRIQANSKIAVFHNVQRALFVEIFSSGMKIDQFEKMNVKQIMTSPFDFSTHRNNLIDFFKEISDSRKIKQKVLVH